MTEERSSILRRALDGAPSIERFGQTARVAEVGGRVTHVVADAAGRWDARQLRRLGYLNRLAGVNGPTIHQGSDGEATLAELAPPSGRTLRQITEDDPGAVSWREAVAVVSLAADTVNDAHLHGVSHGALTADAVTIDDDGVLSVSYPGPFLDGEPTEVDIAPEFEGRLAASERGDVWGLGRILHDAIVDDDETPSAVLAVAEQATSDRPEQRPVSASAFAALLRRAAGGNFGTAGNYHRRASVAATAGGLPLAQRGPATDITEGFGIGRTAAAGAAGVAAGAAGFAVASGRDDVQAPETDIDLTTAEADIDLTETEADIDLTTAEADIDLTDADVDTDRPGIGTAAVAGAAGVAGLAGAAALSGRDADIDLPDADLAINTPDVDLPDADLDIDTPDVDLPDADLDIDTPDVDLPDADLDIDTPDIDLPDADLDVDIPDADVDVDTDRPGIGTAAVAGAAGVAGLAGAAALSGRDADIGTPDVDVPDADLDVDLPDADLEVDVPDADVDVDLPDTEGGIGTGTLAAGAAGAAGLAGAAALSGRDADIDLPDADIDIDAPDVDLPDADVPDAAAATVTKPSAAAVGTAGAVKATGPAKTAGATSTAAVATADEVRRDRRGMALVAAGLLGVAGVTAWALSGDDDADGGDEVAVTTTVDGGDADGGATDDGDADGSAGDADATVGDDDTTTTTAAETTTTAEATTTTEAETTTTTEAAVDTEDDDAEDDEAETFPEADGPPAAVEIVHGVPDTPVDVYLDGDLVVPGFAPGTIAGPADLASGPHRVQLFAPSDDPAQRSTDRDDEPAVDRTVEIAPGPGSLVAHLDADGVPTLSGFTSPQTEIPAGSGRIALRHLAAAGPVSVEIDGDVVADGVTPGSEGIVEVPAGARNLVIRPTDGGDPLLESEVEVADGTLMVLSAAGPDADGQLVVLTQTVSGLGSPPVEVPTGDSGLLDVPTSSAIGLGLAAAVASLLAGMGVRRTRRPM